MYIYNFASQCNVVSRAKYDATL